jgi:DNA-binding transcriptional LysR family regulator
MQKTKDVNPRDVLTPDALEMLQKIAKSGSFAAAARLQGLVPSALTYRVRQIEDALDVLLFDRSSRNAKLTPAGDELLREGARLLQDIDAIAHRVKRVATGWEPQFTLSVDSIISKSTVMELCEAFFAQFKEGPPPTRLKIRDETLSGTLEALVSGQADLAIAVGMEGTNHIGIMSKPLGTISFVYAVAPNHPLANAKEPLSDAVLQQHRAVAVADSIQRGAGLTFGLLGGQDVFTVPSMRDKLNAHLRGLGGGFLPESLARPYIDSGHLVQKKVARPERVIHVSYAWRSGGNGDSDKTENQGRALQWWLHQLESLTTRSALLHIHGNL